MNYVKPFIIATIIISSLTYCAAVGVPMTSDPVKKLGYAIELFNNEMRPFPAEQLIQETIGIYTKEMDEAGLAEAYRVYGVFFQSDAVEKWRKNYEKYGFLDKTAAYETRYDKAIEYLEKSELLYVKIKKYDKLTNVYLRKGFVYEFMEKYDKACEEYKKSLEANKLFIKENPGVPIELPEGVKTYEEYINNFIERLKCK